MSCPICHLMKMGIYLTATTPLPLLASVTIILMDARLVFLFLFYVNMCLYVSPHPIPTYDVRPDTPPMKNLHLHFNDVLGLVILCMCLSVLILSNCDINCRFITFNTRLYTLKTTNSPIRTDSRCFFLVLFWYLIIFENYFIIFLPV